MPINPDGQPVPGMWPHQVNVPGPDGLFISVQIQGSSEATPEMLDATMLDLLDYLQEWPGRRPDADVTGQKYDVRLYLATPTNPIPLPDPPVDPPV